VTFVFVAAGLLIEKVSAAPLGRVVSNSGADTARPGIAAGVGASLSSYGSYIAGLPG
jgi:hypothetical protein